MRRIDPVQIKMIHVAVGQLGLSDDTYRDILHGHYKAESCKDLTYSQASALIDQLKKLGFKIKSVGRAPRARRNAARNVTFLPSRDQFALIDQLKVQIKWHLSDGYERWLAKYIHTTHVRTADQARRAIEGLKGMLKNQNMDSRLRGNDNNVGRDPLSAPHSNEDANGR